MLDDRSHHAYIRAVVHVSVVMKLAEIKKVHATCRSALVRNTHAHTQVDLIENNYDIRTDTSPYHSAVHAVNGS